MPGLRRAQWMVDRTRFHTGIFDTSLLRDGFSKDVGTADVAILPALNEAAGQLLRTGHIKCRFRQQVVMGTNEYTMPPEMGNIVYVTYQGIPLDHTNFGKMDRDTPSWRTTLSGYPNYLDRLGTPRQWYDDIPDVLGILPAPDWTDEDENYSIEILAESLSDDLTDELSYPQRLPAEFHDDLPIGAAIILLNSFGEDIVPGAAARRAELLPLWFGERNGVNAGTLVRVQEWAQHKELSEAGQIVPVNYLHHYRRRW